MKMSEPWWKNGIGYQIYPRSFKDSNGDGYGDISGVIEKLPYLQALGVDFIWLNPIYKSPNVDNGYDISDFQDVQEEFGSLADFRELLTQAHTLGIKIILDLVVNHTSNQHPWFLEAKKGKDNPYRDYYLWADATPTKMPNDWQSFFGGPTWTYDEASQQAYFHIFAPEQPDLNWKNPQLRKEIYDMVEWWLELGIDGFRLDAISHIQKEPWEFQIKDNPWAPFMNVTGIDDYMTDLRGIFRKHQVMTVGEASGVTSKKAVKWTDPDEGYIDMIFELEHNYREGEPGSERLQLYGFKKVLARWQKHLEKNGWNALYVENHDNPRINSILGNETAKSAKAIAMTYMLLKGTPFIYQGQEIGMNNFPFTAIDQVDAKDSHNHYRIMLEEGVDPELALRITTHWTRDHSRTPMQWTADANGGFTTGQPWLAVNPDTTTVNVATEEADPASVLQFYRQLIKFRKSEATFIEGSFDLILAEDRQMFAYLRRWQGKTFVVIANLSLKPKTVDLPTWIAKSPQRLRLENGPAEKLTKRMTFAPYDGYVVELVSE